MSNKLVWLAGFVVVCVTLIAYHSATRIQFYDGWWYLEWAATMDVPRYAIQFLDPANITQGYRPVQGLYMLILYRLFGFNPDGYHRAHQLFHSANAILLMLVVTQLGRAWLGYARAFRIGVVAALAFAVSPVLTLAVFWHAVVDPLSAFFYLLTILLWARYLESHRRVEYWLTFAAYGFALFSKEVAVFLSPILFLIEWWVYRRSVFTRATFQRLIPFLLLLVPYLYLVVSVQSHGEFSSQFGFKIGPHMLANLMPYLAVLTLPWTNEPPTDAYYFGWLGIVAVVYLSVTVYKRSLILLLIALVAALNISPLTGFPLDFYNTRYLYLSLMSALLVAALALDTLARRWLTPRAFAVFVAFLVAVVTLASSLRVADAAATLAEHTRQVRVPFRDIARAHPTFPDDTYLYFVYSPTTNVWDFKGLFFTRYGKQVTVEATDSGAIPELRSHAQAYIYYFRGNQPIELPVEKNIAPRHAPALPVKFGDAITLEQADVSGTTLKRGSVLVVFLTWRATLKPESNLTVFAHLVDAQGKRLAASDSPPRRGAAPTSQWEPNRPPIVDVIVLPIDANAPIGDNYHLELGLYDAPTMQRVPIVGAGDTFIISAFTIVP